MNAFQLRIGARLTWLLGFVVCVFGAVPAPAKWSGAADEPASRPKDLPIYFPPPPPLLGTPVPLPVLDSPPEATPAPPLLAEYVNEIFYPPLSTRLAKKQVTPRQQEKLKNYRAAKVALQDELLNRLESLRFADPATRARALAELALLQAPQIAALERMADELRRDLIHGGTFLQADAHWDVIRDWRLGDAQFYHASDAINAQYQVMLAAAFYQNGLLIEQRGLLREIALELRYTPRRLTEEDSAGAINPPLFFSPPTSRLRLPSEIPAALGEKIARYEREKSILKAELRDAIYAQDNALFERSRSRALAGLAERQWPRIAALEDLAEEIRRDLARAPTRPGPPSPPALPAALTAHITAFVTAKNQLSTDFFRKIEEFKLRFPFIVVAFTATGTGRDDLRLQYNSHEDDEEQVKAFRAASAAFEREVAIRQGQLRNQEFALRRELEAYARRGDGISVEGVLSTYADIIQQREDWSLYDDYQSAMLTPGLSPEQRRLLFDRGLEKLELPLPRWDPITIAVVE